jgi:hypothetical protein
MGSVRRGEKVVDNDAEVFDEFPGDNRQGRIAEVQCLDIELQRWFQSQNDDTVGYV